MVENQIIEYLDIKNPLGKHWQRYSRLNLGVKDVRPRVGTFNTPWNIPNDTNLWAMPDLQYIDDDIGDVADDRALELFNIAKETNREIYIMWSGGIDSTLILTAFLKVLDPADRDILTVVLNTESVLEHMDYYKKYISNQLKIKHLNDINITNEFLDQVMILHGDPGDCLFGPSFGAFSHLVEGGKHLWPAQSNADLIKTFYDKQGGPWAHPDFGEWYVNKVLRNMAEHELENCYTIADFWWWHYFNLKYQFSMQRPLQHMVADFKQGITPDRFARYIKETFFHSDRWQNWSYSNLQTFYTKIHLGSRGQKWQAREYLYAFDKNERYFNHKIKIASVASDRDRRTVEINPFYFDANNVGWYPWEEGVTEAVTYYLENYKG